MKPQTIEVNNVFFTYKVFPLYTRVETADTQWSDNLSMYAPYAILKFDITQPATKISRATIERAIRERLAQRREVVK